MDKLAAILPPPSVPLGSVAGIPIRLHLSWVLLLGLQLLGSIYYGSSAVLLWFLLLGPILLITVLVHELGHCLAARSVGGAVQGILLWPLGGLAFIGHTAGPTADMWVAVAGPLTHVPMVGVWVLLLAIATHATTGEWAISLSMPAPDTAALLGQAVCAGAVAINLSLLAFNLLVPCYPLDGGRLLVDLLLALGTEHELTAKITLGISVPLGLGIIVFGAVVLQMVTIMVGMFILMSCWSLYRHLRDGMLRQHPMFAFTEDAAASEHAYWKFNSEPSSAAV